MLNRLFGNYLISKKLMTQEQLDHLLPVPKELIAKPETIAIVNKNLTPMQVQEILSYQAHEGKTFEEAAQKKRYLTEEKAEQLIQYQNNPFMCFMQLLWEHQILQPDNTIPALDAFQNDNQFNNAQMHALLEGDLEQTVGIFVPMKNPALKELTVILVQTLRKLIDKDVYLDKAYMARSIQIDRYAAQLITGDICVKLYLSAPMNNLLAIANHFTSDTYQTVDMDALDNVGEFINCVSGLFATNLSYEDINIDMNAPEFAMEGPYLNSGKLFVIPIHANHYSFRAILEMEQ